jgi:hypothetical protein
VGAAAEAMGVTVDANRCACMIADRIADRHVQILDAWFSNGYEPADDTSQMMLHETQAAIESEVKNGN